MLGLKRSRYALVLGFFLVTDQKIDSEYVYFSHSDNQGIIYLIYLSNWLLHEIWYLLIYFISILN